MAEETGKTSTIKIEVKFNASKQIEDIKWQASDSEIQEPKNCKTFVFSAWDPDENVAFGINLWTNKMMVEEMNHFTYQTMMTLAENFAKATGNAAGAKEITAFAQKFGLKHDVLKNT